MAGRIDWDAVRARLAAPPAPGRDQLTAEQRATIFDRRAEELAGRPAAPARGAGFEALVFALGSEQYALPSAQVQEVRVLDQLTPLPGTPSFIAGLINVRGRIVPVLDPRPLFGLPVSGQAPDTALLLAGGAGQVGLLVTSRPSIRWLPTSPLGPLPAGAPPGLDAAFVRGVTPDLVIVLDADRLLADRRLLVEQEA